MITAGTLIVATLVLGAGTFAFRWAGPVLRARIDLPPRAEKLLAIAAVVLLAALVGTAALLDGAEFAGIARPAGVTVGGVLAWRKAPFVVIVLAAAGTAAVLRLLGVP
ncbi:AzlD domain-containing protein [Saccharomonospora sp. NPDC046836]|uniref:AzlD domain-containing protein n=1 Tax=Saccharomonospora sp. NPDC046836 TaxID=3156921 RepID=UPI0033CEBF6A